jgi:peptide/nickel transport system permease protein
MGTLLLNSLRDGDTAVLLPWMLVVGVIVILANLLADVLYAALDPRVRLA